jgi:hypothetical protein
MFLVNVGADVPTYISLQLKGRYLGNGGRKTAKNIIIRGHGQMKRRNDTSGAPKWKVEQGE